MRLLKTVLAIGTGTLGLCLAAEPAPAIKPVCSYDRQMQENLTALGTAPAAARRATAATALGVLRGYAAVEALTAGLKDPDPAVRRATVISLGLCGDRQHLGKLLESLDDADWTVRQAAGIALSNLTGMLLPFNGLAEAPERALEAKAWRDWIAKLKPGQTPKEVLELADALAWEPAERGIRALGALGGQEAEAAILKRLKPYRSTAKAAKAVKNDEEKRLIQACFRSLARLKGPEALPVLTEFLGNTQWARYAADALGDLGDPRAIPALVEKFPLYANSLAKEHPAQIPPHDKPGLSPLDRIYATPYAFALALSRLTSTTPEAGKQLQPIIPVLLANVAGDYDGGMMYEPEAWQLIWGDLLDRCQARQAVCDIAFRQLGSKRPRPELPGLDKIEPLAATMRKRVGHNDESNTAASWLAAFCRNPADAPDLIALLASDDGWVRINAAKTLLFMNHRAAIKPMLDLLAASKPEADYGYCGIFNFKEPKPAGQDEYSDPSPRWREGFIHCLGRFGATEAVPLLIQILESDKNVLEVRHAAALELDRIGTPEALAALKKAEATHPYHTIRIVAREALWRRGIAPLPPTPAIPRTQLKVELAAAPAASRSFVFIKGSLKPANAYQMDNWRQLYATSDSGPTYRPGDNLFRLDLVDGKPKVTPLTQFKEGYVADCEVSWDAKRIIFCRRGGDTDPWWHLYEMDTDGGNLRQLTSGPYHDVQPNYLADGRIVFSSSRLGARDEYHGYLATGLATMNPDGSDIQIIGLNLGRDAEPVLLNDGRIGFSRLELFYSRLKTEWNVEAASPDGTRPVVLYGPERRQFWLDATKGMGIGWVQSGLRHRTLRISQLQPFGGQILAITQKGLTIVGKDRNSETFIPHDQAMVVTTPFPLDAATILCAAGAKKSMKENKTPLDLGLYLCDVKTGKLDLLYDDPGTADFEARPLLPRTPPIALAEAPRSNQYSGRLVCTSALFSRDPLVKERGRYVRLVEALPSVTRYQTQTSNGTAWKNHAGTQTRDLGIVPLGPDGSFNLEVPADRLIHCQVLDSDRHVVGNQQIWMYVRPGEIRSCVGCHEQPDSAPPGIAFPRTSREAAIPCLPAEGAFSYRAKIWNKGSLTDEEEERVRTVQAINLMGRN